MSLTEYVFDSFFFFYETIYNPDDNDDISILSTLKPLIFEMIFPAISIIVSELMCPEPLIFNMSSTGLGEN
jgi:hypothetical protein